jgi:hypothetical protein
MLGDDGCALDVALAAHDDPLGIPINAIQLQRL